MYFVYKGVIEGQGVTTIMKSPKPELIHHYNGTILRGMLWPLAACPAVNHLVQVSFVC
jgi:hypothetical protein